MSSLDAFVCTSQYAHKFKMRTRVQKKPHFESKTNSFYITDDIKWDNDCLTFLKGFQTNKDTFKGGKITWVFWDLEAVEVFFDMIPLQLLLA